MIRNTRSFSLAAALGAALAVSSVAAAQTPPPPAAPALPAVTLKAGDKAPPLVVEKFMRGEPVKSFEPGRVYVLEFWATWCGPCVAAMPHLSALAAEYKAKKVTFVGVNIWEDPKYNDKTEGKVTEFLAGKGKVMEYAVAYDGATKASDTAWMAAAGRNGIPTTFVVDGKGVIAWIGHPAVLDYVLDEVVSGRWDVAAGPKKITEARTALMAACKKYAESYESGEKAWAEASKSYSMLAAQLADRRYAEMLLAGHEEQAYAVGRAMFEAAKLKKDSTAMMVVVVPMLELPGRPNATGRKLAEEVGAEVFALGEATDPGRHICMVQIALMLGNTEEAKKHREKATELIPAEQKTALGRWLDELEAKAAKKK